MLSPSLRLHRVLLAAVLLGNAFAFAGVDPWTRLATAAAALLLALDLHEVPPVPRLHRIAVAGVGLLAVVQLVPLPLAARRVLAPGLAAVLPAGWRPLSVAPWSTVQVVASLAVAVILALVAARMTRTRSGLPQLLAVIAAVAGLLALLGLAGEAGGSGRVMLVRANTGGGSPYGPYVNHNHFAVGMELALPAAVVLLAAAGRHLRLVGAARRRSTVIALAAGTTVAMGLAALLRCGSRGGLLALTAAAAVTAPLWWRRGRGVRWPWAVLATVIFAGAVTLAWGRVPELRDGMSELLVVEGVQGNTRWDLWRGALHLAGRSPLLGTGLGTFQHAAGLDKPATGALVLQQAHNDWLEWLADGGAAGAVLLMLGVAGVAAVVAPHRTRRIRFEYRYAVAGASLALLAAGLHEVIGFGLQTPLNRYLAAVWIGLLWGVVTMTRDERTAPAPSAPGEVGP